MDEEKVVIRSAKIEDAAEIANVHLNSWREAYKDLLPAEFLDSLPLTFKRRRDRWQKSLSDPTSTTKVYVAEAEKPGIVGFITWSPPRDEKYKDWGEICAVYLLAAFKRKQIGYKMLNIAFHHLKADGFENAYCWVLKDNPTCAFYKRTGGVLLEGDTKSACLGGRNVIELVYKWNLSSIE